MDRGRYNHDQELGRLACVVILNLSGNKLMVDACGQRICIGDRSLFGAMARIDYHPLLFNNFEQLDLFG